MLLMIFALFLQVPDPAAIRAKHAQENADRNANVPAAMKERSDRLVNYKRQSEAVSKRRAAEDAAKKNHPPK